MKWGPDDPDGKKVCQVTPRYFWGWGDFYGHVYVIEHPGKRAVKIGQSRCDIGGEKWKEHTNRGWLVRHWERVGDEYLALGIEDYVFRHENTKGIWGFLCPPTPKGPWDPCLDAGWTETASLEDISASELILLVDEGKRMIRIAYQERPKRR
ncbi:hypothetical protein [Streptomyces erythrochromogenes]|uniref:hypothetical protein n=1 Tax=Streptomyces erythrochromogenes TaxID=285574 RepID=UPI0036B261F9